MKTVITYQSKTGFTRKYAEWLAGDLSADLFDIRKVTEQKLLEYDSIVHFGGLYVGGILGFSKLKKSYDQLNSKKLIAVAVGATTKKEEACEEIISRNFSEEMKGKVSFYLLRGGMDYSKMGLIDRILMFMLTQKIRRTPESKRDDEEKGILAFYGKSVDFTNRNALAPIIEELKQYRKA